MNGLFGSIPLTIIPLTIFVASRDSDRLQGQERNSWRVLRNPVRAIRGVPCRAARCRTDASKFRRTNPKRTTSLWAKEVLNCRLVAGDVEFFKVAVEGNDLNVVFTSTGGEEGVRESDVDGLQTFESRKHLTGVAELYAVLLK